MTFEAFNAFCQSLRSTTYVMQWGGSHVWKVGGKVFAIGGGTDGAETYSFKVSPIAYEILRSEPGLRPAPYLASRGMTWIQHYQEPGLDDDLLREHLSQSHQIVAQGLSKKLRQSLLLGVD